MNFHCAHLHRFFPLKKGLSKTHQSSLTLKGGSTAFPKPIFSWRRLAALGIVQASLTLLSFAQPFPSGYRGCTNRPFNSLYDPFGSPCRGQKRCSNRYAIRLADHQRFFRKPTSPPLSLREGPPLSPSPFPLRVQGMYQPPYSVLKPLRYKVGGPSEVYASFLCGMGPQGENLLKNGCVGWDHRDKMDGALRNLLILSSYSP